MVKAKTRCSLTSNGLSTYGGRGEKGVRVCLRYKSSGRHTWRDNACAARLRAESFTFLEVAVEAGRQVFG